MFYFALLLKTEPKKITDFHGAVAGNSFSRSALRFVSSSVVFQTRRSGPNSTPVRVEIGDGSGRSRCCEGVVVGTLPISDEVFEPFEQFGVSAEEGCRQLDQFASADHLLIEENQTAEKIFVNFRVAKGFPDLEFNKIKYKIYWRQKKHIKVNKCFQDWVCKGL